VAVTEPTDEAAGLAALERRRPDIVGLARLASVATIIEPPLLRRLRLELGGRVRAEQAGGHPAGGWHAGTEADLWFSDLAHVATAGQLTLRPAVLEVLRGQLGGPAHRATAGAARRLVVAAHREHTDMVRLEERIIWSSMIGDASDVGDAFERALATLKLHPERAAEVVRWFLQARRRLPASALAHDAGRRLLAAVAMHVDRVIAPEILAGDRFPDGLADLAPLSLPVTTVGVQVIPGGLRFVPPSDPDAGVLTLPHTRPLALEASWQDPGGDEHVAVVRADAGLAAALDGLAGRAVLRTISGQRYHVESTRSRRVVVALFGTVPGWTSLSDSEISRRVTAAHGAPEVTVQVVREPPDVYARPEILVVSDQVDLGRSGPALNAVMSGLARAVAHTGVGEGEVPAIVIDFSPLGNEVLADVMRPTLRGVEVPIWLGDTNDPEGTVAAAVGRIVANPRRLYTLDVRHALNVLQSVAVAFHVRLFHRAEVEDQQAEQALFDLPPEEDPDAPDVATATFHHVRGMCEWIFAGPVRGYLDGQDDPTQVPVEPREPQTGLLVDEMGRDYTSVGWSPSGERWASFEAYFSWFTQQWQAYARMLRDRLGAGLILNDYSVAMDDLEAARLAIGTAALPLGSDEVLPYMPYMSGGLFEPGSSHPSESRDRPREMEPPPRTVYPIERAHLPELITALAAPVLAAVEAEAAQRAARRQQQVPTTPDSIHLIVTVEPGSDSDELRWTLGNAGAELTQVVTRGGSAGLTRVVTRARGDSAEFARTLARTAFPSFPPGVIEDVSREIAAAFPAQFWSDLASVDAESGGRPMITFRSDLDVPWELAEARLPSKISLPPFLGCHAVVAQLPGRVSSLELTVGGDIAVIGPGYGGGRSSTLRGAEAEAAELVQHYGARRLPTDLGGVLGALRGDDRIGILHLTGHSVRSGDDIEPGLLLDDGSRLTSRELTYVRLASAPLVVLNTAGSTALAAAFLRAGAAAVIAAMWQVSDEAAAEFASRFYAGVLEEEVPPAEMLRRLRCGYRRGADGIGALAYRFFGHPSLVVRGDRAVPSA
jgi:hypothetical protein